jgi:hypothetical protein
MVVLTFRKCYQVRGSLVGPREIFQAIWKVVASLIVFQPANQVSEVVMAWFSELLYLCLS